MPLLRNPTLPVLQNMKLITWNHVLFRIRLFTIDSRRTVKTSHFHKRATKPGKNSAMSMFYWSFYCFLWTRVGTASILCVGLSSATTPAAAAAGVEKTGTLNTHPLGAEGEGTMNRFYTIFPPHKFISSFVQIKGYSGWRQETLCDLKVFKSDSDFYYFLFGFFMMLASDWFEHLCS